MKLIADSGSTKADWKLVQNNEVIKDIHTKGYNPYYWTAQEITQELQPIFHRDLDTNTIQEVYYYGAGCSADSYNKIIEDGLQPIFPNAKIFVKHDLLAAARATCYDEPGISCILGTGSNSCLFDGNTILDNVANLAYIVGDEGSGSHIGKAILQAYFYKEMPADLAENFKQMYPHDKGWFMKKIYEEETPNAFLASLTHFCSTSKDQFFIKKLVYDCFKLFIERHLTKYENYKNYKVHFVGSIAYYFSDILSVALNEKGMTLGRIIKKPIDNLVNYHTQSMVN